MADHSYCPFTGTYVHVYGIRVRVSRSCLLLLLLWVLWLLLLLLLLLLLVVVVGTCWSYTIFILAHEIHRDLLLWGDRLMMMMMRRRRISLMVARHSWCSGSSS